MKKLSVIMVVLTLILSLYVPNKYSVRADESPLKITENFETVSSIRDTVFYSDAESQDIITDGAISGTKSLLLQNPRNKTLNILGISPDNTVLKNGTDYVFEFKYKIARAIDMHSMQFTINEDKYIKFNSSSLSVFEGDNNLKQNTIIKKDDAGVVTVTISFKTSDEGKNSLKLQGDLFGVGKTKIIIDELLLIDVSKPDEDAGNDFNPINEDFETAIDIFDDTVFWSDAKTQNITSEGAISGNKSLVLENEPKQWFTVLGITADEVGLTNSTDFYFTFSYKIDKPEDMTAMQFVFNDVQYMRFNCTSLAKYEGTQSLIDNTSIKMKYETGVVTVRIRFTTSPTGTNFFKIEGDTVGENSTRIVFDDIKIEVAPPEVPVSERPVITDFEYIDELEATGYTSNSVSTQVVTEGAISGNKSLLIQNPELEFNELLMLNSYKFKPNTSYEFSFDYKIDHPDDMNSMQFVLSDDKYVRFNCTTLSKYEGNITSAARLKRNDENGVVNFSIVFKTPENFTSYSFKLQGGIWKMGKPLRIIIDNLSLTEFEMRDYSTSENFENVTTLDDTAFYSDASYQEVETENAILGNKSLHVKNNPSNFLTVIGLDTAKYQLKPNTSYFFKFTYRISKPEDMDSLQISTGVNYARFNCSSLGIYEGSDEFCAATNISRNSNGSVTVSVNFKTKADGSESKLVVEGDIWGISQQDIYIDDIKLKVLDENYVYTPDEDFEDIDDLDLTSYFFGGNSSIVTSALSGKKSVKIENGAKGWFDAVAMNGSKIKIEKEKNYKISFLYSEDDIDALQFVIGSTAGMRFIRWNSADGNTIAGDYYAFNLKVKDLGNGVKFATVEFKTNSSDTKFSLAASSASDTSSLYLDNITIS